MASRAPRSVVLVCLVVVVASAGVGVSVGVSVGATSGAGASATATDRASTDASSASLAPGTAAGLTDPGVVDVAGRGTAASVGSTATTTTASDANENESGSGSGGGTGTESDSDSGGGTGTRTPADEPPPPTDVVLDSGGGVEPQSAPAGSTRVLLVGTDADAVEPGDVRARGGEVVGVDGRRVEARVPLAALPALRGLEWVASVRPAPVAVPSAVGEGVAVVGADDLHAANLTGENVSVGVIDAGFDPNATDVADQVAATRAFGTGLSETPDHGTGVAEVVAETAPGADLHLAAYEGATNYARAVEWLVESDVDVVVMSVAWLGEPADGTGYVSRTAESAVDAGAVWVGSAGNYGEKHWQGRFNDTTGDRVHDFGGTLADPDEVNYLSDPDEDDDRWRLEPGDTVYAVLEWDDWPGEDVAAWRNESDDYDLHLFYYGGANDTTTVARSRQSHDGWDAPVEVLEYTVDREGSYGVYVSREQDGPGNPTIELFTVDTGQPEYSVPTGSVVAPAASERTVSVGAFRHETLEREPFSSVGPTDDGRRGVDLLGPDGVANDVYGEFYGTSAAAPSVAGVVALLRGANPTLSPAGVADRLAGTAVDAGTPGPDTRSGYGRVDAAAAVAPDVRVDGRLVADGEAVTTERVQLRRPGGTATATNRTDGDGRFRLYLRPNGTQDLVVSDLGDAGAHDGVPDLYAVRRFEPPGGADLGEVSLPEGHPVSVRVVDEFGRPLPNATVRVAHEQSDGATAAVRMRTDAEGTGVLLDADARRLELAGTVVVTATPPAGSRAVAADVELEVRVSESRDVTLSLPVRARVEVANVTASSVVAGDEPLAVNATVLNRGGSVGSATRVAVRLDRDRDGRLEPSESIANRSVLAPPGTPVPVRFETDLDVPSGEYPLAVVTPNDTALRTVTVRQAANLSPSVDAPRNVSVDATVPVTVRVENRGGEVGNVTPVELRLDEDRDGRLTSAETRANRTVSLPPGANETLRFELSTDGLVPGEYALGAVTRDGVARTTLDVMVPALYDVDLDAPTSVAVGDEPTLVARVQNGGGDLGATTEFSVRLDRDGDGSLDPDEAVTSRRLRVPGGESTTVEVPLSTLGVPPGEYALGVVVGSVSDRAPLTVRASYARLVVTRTAVPTVPANGSAAVEIEFRNVGGNLSRDLGASASVDWDGDGDFASDETLAAVPLSLASGERRTVRVTVSGDHPEGEYPLRLSTPNETVERTLVVGETPFPDGLPQLGGTDGPLPLDADDDGLYEDVDGDGRVDLSDAFTLAFADLDAVNDDPGMRDALDFDGDGRVTLADVFHYAFELLDSGSASGSDSDSDSASD